MAFKIGDTVRRINSKNGDCGGANVGQIATVQDIDNLGDLWVKYDECMHERGGLEMWSKYNAEHANA